MDACPKKIELDDKKNKEIKTRLFSLSIVREILGRSILRRKSLNKFWKEKIKRLLNHSIEKGKTCPNWYMDTINQ